MASLVRVHLGKIVIKIWDLGSGFEQNRNQNMEGSGSGQNCGRLLKVVVSFEPLRDSNMSLLSYFVAHIKTAIDDKDVDNENGTRVDILD